jgi:hypothetical protein
MALSIGIKFEKFWGKNKARALHRFKVLDDVSVLVLTKEGAHGLDLSFVTHIFLMNTIGALGRIIAQLQFCFLPLKH